MARIANRLAAATWASKNTLKKSSNREERAMRFQRWLDESPFAGRTTGFPEAWREYQRSQRCVQVGAPLSRLADRRA